jgi:ParB/RepB/Spo0J family partition protein
MPLPTETIKFSQLRQEKNLGRIFVGELRPLVILLKSSKTVDPLTVVKVQNKSTGVYTYRIVDGHRRYAALKIIQKENPKLFIKYFEEINVQLFEGTKTKEKIKAIASNNGRKNVSCYELGIQFIDLNQSGYNNVAIAEETGYSIGHVSNCIGVVKDLIPEILKVLKEGKEIPQRHLFYWKSLTRSKQEKEFKKWLGIRQSSKQRLQGKMLPLAKAHQFLERSEGQLNDQAEAVAKFLMGLRKRPPKLTPQ